MNTSHCLRGSIAVLVMVVGVAAATPSASSAGEGAWLDHLAEVVRQHQTLARRSGAGEAYEAYLAHLDEVRESLARGDAAATYRLMNRFMQMLEMRAAGIPDWSAKALFDYCGQVTPPMYHDVSRHLPRT